MKNKKLIIILTFFSLAVFSCSTEKNTAIRRLYHNTTAYFNIYFNGYESFKNGLKTIEETPEDYTQLLPVYKAERKDIQSNVSGDMDNAIKKAVKMIKMHSITAKPKRKEPKKGKRGYKLTDKEKEFYAKTEYNKYVDDAYLLIGKAHYYKGDYIGGLKSLHLIINKFRNDEIKFDALYWIARIKSAEKNYAEASNYLKLITEDPKHPERLDKDIDYCHADIFIKQKQYAKAVDKLAHIISKTRKKKEKARLYYLTAQLYQKIEKGDKSIELFTKLIKMNAPYEMIFNAKINMAKSFLSSSTDSKEIRKILGKMLRDNKNIDFQDQIYYVLGGIEQKENNEPLAIENYKLSVNKSVSNDNQKALSYLKLAEIYFKNRKYMAAGNYFDSTMSVLRSDYPDYESISKKASNISALTDNLKIIIYEDSVQRVAAMDSTERNAYIAALIAKVKADEIAERNAGQSSFRNNEFIQGDYRQNAVAGKWYFYNPQAISIGKSEFLKVWGRRKLEDHWRRKNKKTVFSEDELESNETQQDSGRVTDNKDPQYYLQDLPLTDSLIALSNARIAQAYFNSGVVYDKKMQDFPKSEESYQTLIKRFPKNDLVLEAYFNLYLLNTNSIKNKSAAEKYRKIILQNYPYSKYAQILSDPNYLVKLEENKNTINKLYKEAYSAYKKSNYSEVIAKTNAAFKIDEANFLSAKFLYLKAISAGSMGQRTQMKTMLEDIVKKYPRDEISPNAQAVIDLLNSGKYDPNYYTNEKDSAYYYMAIVPKDDAAVNKVKYVLTTFNAITYPKENYQTALSELNEESSVLIVKSFSDIQSCKNYYGKLESSEKFRELPTNSCQSFIISSKNFEKLKKLPITEKFIKFYTTNRTAM